MVWACQTQLPEIREGFSKEDRGCELNSEGGVQLAYKAGVCKGRGIKATFRLGPKGWGQGKTQDSGVLFQESKHLKFHPASR